MLGMEAGREGKVDVRKEGRREGGMERERWMDRWIERCDLSFTPFRKGDVHVLSSTSTFVSPAIDSTSISRNGFCCCCFFHTKPPPQSPSPPSKQNPLLTLHFLTWSNPLLAPPPSPLLPPPSANLPITSTTGSLRASSR